MGVKLKSFKSSIKQNRTLFNLLFPIYALIRYPHFLLSGIVLKIINKPITSGNLKLIFPKKNTSSLFVGSLFFGLSEEDEKLSLDKYLNSDAVVLELGGCLGVISCYINDKLTNKENHIVLEANPNLIPYLEKNRELNNHFFKVKNKVISEFDFIDFFVAKSIHSSSLISETHEKHIIEGISIMNLQKETALIFNTLVMDIEGGELELILKTNFKELSIVTIIFELHDFNSMLNPSEVKKINEKLKNDGFVFREKIGTTVIYLKK
jgi:FkbM family methyltransferase